MREVIWTALIALPLAVVGSVLYAHAQQQSGSPEPAAAPYLCPLTGEELPCPRCCPLNGGK
jgi:hypothetical protein